MTTFLAASVSCSRQVRAAAAPDPLVENLIRDSLTVGTAERECDSTVMGFFRKVRPGVVDPADMTVADNWYGGYYELCIKLGDADDGRLDRAAAAMWQAADLGDAFQRPQSGGSQWTPSTVTASNILSGHLGSVADVPDLGRCVCAVMVVREEVQEGAETRFGADWLDLSLPLGALSHLDERVGAFPFGDPEISRAWREPIEEWFARIASAVYGAVPFVYAVTGNEVSGVEPDEVGGGLALHLPSDDGSRLVRKRVENW